MVNKPFLVKYLVEGKLDSVVIHAPDPVEAQIIFDRSINVQWLEDVSVIGIFPQE